MLVYSHPFKLYRYLTPTRNLTPDPDVHPRAGPWSLPNQAIEDVMQPVLALRGVISPVVSGVERLPDPLTTGRPLLFVGNHTRFGLYDLPMLVSCFWTMRSPSPALRTHQASGLPVPRVRSVGEVLTVQPVLCCCSSATTRASGSTTSPCW